MADLELCAQVFLLQALKWEQLPHPPQHISKQPKLLIKCQAKAKIKRWNKSSHLMNRYSSRKCSNNNRNNSNKGGSKKKNCQCNKSKHHRLQNPPGSKLRTPYLLGRRQQWRPQSYKTPKKKT